MLDPTVDNTVCLFMLWSMLKLATKWPKEFGKDRIEPPFAVRDGDLYLI